MSGSRRRYLYCLMGKTPIDVVREHLGQTRMIVRDLTEQANLFEQWQKDLALPVAPCDEAKNLATAMRIATELWECVDDGRIKSEEWGGLPVPLLDPNEIDSTILRYQRAIQQAERGLPTNTVLPPVRALGYT